MKGRRAERRRPASGAASAPALETIDIRTSDAWSLRADVHEPEGRPVGVVVLAHAAMARRSSFDRPRRAGLVGFLVHRGWRVIPFDFRGHGESGAGAGQRGSWEYDDLVSRDLPAVYAFARARAEPGLPVVAIGHSLGGHVTLAAQGTGRVSFDAIVGVAANVWVRELEDSPARWLVKRAVLAAGLRIARRAGRLPARALRAGTDDESVAFFEDFERFSRRGWASRDGAEDYMAALARVTCPALQVTSKADRLYCAPVCGQRFMGRCGGPCATEHVVRSDDGGPPPDHMGLVTSGKIHSVWQRIERWMPGRG